MTHWHSAAKRYLARLGDAEYALHLTNGRGSYSPSDYHRDLIDHLNADDEHAFKALKLQRGGFSALGV